MKNVTVLFPGIGYTCDRPLLYYAGKLAASLGHQVIRVPYGHFPDGVKGDPEKMRQAFLSALAQAEELLRDVDWSAYETVTFIGKSVGTVVAGAYAKKHHLKVRFILLTPVMEAFDQLEGLAIAFHGTADPWAQTADVIKTCGAMGIPLFLTENANQSLETGNVAFDIQTVGRVMERVAVFMREPCGD